MRYARRSTLTAAAMVVGLALLVIFRTLGDGTHEAWIEAAVQLGEGHLTIEAPGFLQSGQLSDRLSAAEREAAMRALATPALARHVAVVAPRLEMDGLANTASGSAPVHIVAVDPATEAQFSLLRDKQVGGRYLEPGDRLQAYLGTGLADLLDVRLGSRLVLTAPDPSGEVVGQLVRVVGTFRTGIPEVDYRTVQIPLALAGDWLRLGPDVTSLAILLRSKRDVAAVNARLRAALDATPVGHQVAVLTWRETNPELAAAVRVDDAYDSVFYLILFAIIALAVVNTVLMSVLYRTREFGLVQAFGLSPRQTGALVFGEGIILTAVSGLLGAVLGLAATWVFWRHGLDLSFLVQHGITVGGVIIEPVLLPQFRVAQVLESLGFILLIGALASFYPAYKASRVEIAEAVKLEQ